MNKRIVIIGAGNVAYSLAKAILNTNNFSLCQIYSRTIESARSIGVRTGVAYTDNILEVYPDSDIYIYAVSDTALQNIIPSIHIREDALLLHTSGGISLDIFSKMPNSHGVIYPLQTFTKGRELDFKEIPLLLEWSDKKSCDILKKLAAELSDVNIEVDSYRRKLVHLSAVFVCNFTNHLYDLSSRFLEDNDMDFDILRPLIRETADKIMSMKPEYAQTGPAKRGDDIVISAHKKLMKKRENMMEIYDVMTESIFKLYKKEDINIEVEEENTYSISNPTLW